MAKHIHIHLPARTKDAGFEESKHPRKADGKFGSGGAGGKTPATQQEKENFRKEMLDKHQRGVTFYYNNQTQKLEARHKGKLVGTLDDPNKPASSKPPSQVTHKGKNYSLSGKTGKHASSGEASAEYEEYDDKGKRTGARVWRTASGQVYED